MDLQTPLVRRSDPESSHAAAKDFVNSGKRQNQEERILHAIRKYPGRTAGEIGRICGLSNVQVCRRTGRLEAEKLIERGAVRKCAELKSPQQTWWPATRGHEGQMRLGV